MPDALTHHDEPPGDCGDAARDLLPALLHGRLAGAQRAQAEAHVAACAACAAEFALVSDARSALVAAGPAVDVAAIAAAVRSATLPRAAAPAPARPGLPPATLRGPSRWRTAPAWRAAAAGLVLVLGSGAALASRGVWGGSGAEVAVARAARSATAPSPREVAATTSAAVGTSAPAQVSAQTGAAGRPTPVQLADAAPALGTRFDDLSDDELQAVLDAVEGASGALPGAEPEEAGPVVELSGAR